MVIHRTVFGSIEWFIGILIEHYAGMFPLWLSPVQVKILTITDRCNSYADKMLELLESYGIRAKADYCSEKIGLKIREARNERVPYIAVIGDMELENESLSVRMRGIKDSVQMTPKELGNRVAEDVREKR